MSGAAIDQYREPGAQAFFEYHCYESHDSADAQLWYRSHQQVTVLRCVNADEYGSVPQDERFDAGQQLVYTVRFADRFEGDAFEDELLDSEDSYQRPDPPCDPLSSRRARSIPANTPCAGTSDIV